MRLVRVVTAASGRLARSTAAQGFASRQSEVASPAGLEPATCGLEIRCCYPAELRGRDRKLLPQERLHLPAPQRAAPTGSPADRRHGQAPAMLALFFCRPFRSVRNW